MNYLDIFVSAFTLTFIFSNPLSERMKIQYKLLLFIITLCCNTLLFYSPAVTYVTVAFLLLIIALSTKNRLINIIAALCGYIVSVLSNNFLILLSQILFNADATAIYENLAYLIVFYILVFLVTYSLTALLGRFMKKHFSSELSTKYRNTAYLLFLEVLLCATIFVFNITFGRQTGYPQETILFNCVLFFIYFVLSTLLLLNVVRATQKSILMEQQEQQYKQLQDYMHNLEKTALKLREFKHDYLNTLMTLDTLIHTDVSSNEFQKSHHELITYFDTCIKSDSRHLQSINTQLIGLSKLNDPAVKSLLSAKLSFASLEKIDIRLEIADKVEHICMNSLDLSRIMGIFLDNAIEAAMGFTQASEKEENAAGSFIHVAFIQQKDCLQISVENSCSDETIPLEKLADYGFSTKGTERGYGLYEAAQVLSRYKNVLHKTTQQNNLFTQTLLIYPENEKRN